MTELSDKWSPHPGQAPLPWRGVDDAFFRRKARVVASTCRAGVSGPLGLLSRGMSTCPDHCGICGIGRRSSRFGSPTGGVPITACARASPQPSRGASGRALPQANRSVAALPMSPNADVASSGHFLKRGIAFRSMTNMSNICPGRRLSRRYARKLQTIGQTWVLLVLSGCNQHVRPLFGIIPAGLSIFERCACLAAAPNMRK